MYFIADLEIRTLGLEIRSLEIVTCYLLKTSFNIFQIYSIIKLRIVHERFSKKQSSF